MKAVDLLQAVLDIAVEAGRRIMDIHGSADVGITEKADHSPLTRADMAAHQYIASALATLTPTIPLLSEEDADIDFAVRRLWSRYWLVDPLDGTKEFIGGSADFTVNIALIEDGYPVLGVIVAPALGLQFFAAQGGGAFQIRDGRLSVLHTRSVPARPVYVVSRSHRNPELEAFLAAAPDHEARSRGSSLKFCQIAAGEADLYPRTGPTSEWDTAAGQCIAEQAGALVLRLPDLSRLRYNQKASLLNPLFAVIGDGDHDWKPLLATITA